MYGPNCTTFVAVVTTLTPRVAHIRTDEGIPFSVSGVLAVRNDRLFARRASRVPRTAVGCAGCHWGIAFRNRRQWLRLRLVPGHDSRNPFRATRLLRTCGSRRYP